MNAVADIMPGSRVSAWRIKNVLDGEFLPGTVVRRYGTSSGAKGLRFLPEYVTNGQVWRYPDCVDIIFDQFPDKVSHGHFTSGGKI